MYSSGGGREIKSTRRWDVLSDQHGRRSLRSHTTPTTIVFGFKSGEFLVSIDQFVSEVRLVSQLVNWLGGTKEDNVA